MVYGRDVAGQTLAFEASGALMEGTLVMRDDRTDSWWSIITSDAIGGPLKGTRLVELLVGRKMQWAEWREAHPGTRVLSVGGVEHLPGNGYAAYFANDRTFRDQPVSDRRLAAKAPVFAFQYGGKAWAVPHSVAEGGAVLRLSKRERLVVYRRSGAAVFASTEVWRVSAAQAGGAVLPLIASLRVGMVQGAAMVPGFDTFWYTWAGIHEHSQILR